MLRTGLNGSALVALLSQWQLAPVPLTPVQLAPIDGPPHTPPVHRPVGAPPLVEGLGRWLGWTDAIALAAALNAPTNAGDGPGAASAADRAAWAAPVEVEFARVRATLEQAIEDDGASARHPRRSDRSALAASGPMVAPRDFLPHRQRYLLLQQVMESRIGPLRNQARAAVARGPAALSRLAAIDAVLDPVVGARQQALLATLPSLLEKHFERVRPAPPAASRSDGEDGPDEQPPSGDWLIGFRRTMQQMLHAELELRLQPVQGLLDALRSTQPQGIHA